MFRETPEARRLIPPPARKPTDPDRFVIELTKHHRWDVIDRLGEYTLWRGIAAGANYQKQALEAYERGDLEEAMRMANLAVSTEKRWS